MEHSQYQKQLCDVMLLFCHNGLKEVNVCIVVTSVNCIMFAYSISSTYLHICNVTTW